MSFQAMAWAVKQKVGNATGKAILLMLANYADERGECFPSQETLASECECSKRSVLDWLQKFEDIGILTRERRHGTGGYRRADLIRLSLGAVNSRENISGENPSKPKCRTFTAEPITEPINTSSLRSDVPARAQEKPSVKAELMQVLDLEHAQAVMEHRKAIKKAMTPRAAHLLAAEFAKCQDPNAAADMMIAAGWQGFKAEWAENRNTTRNRAQPGRSGSGNAAVDFLDQMISKMENHDDDFSGPTIEGSILGRNDNGNPQAVSGFAATRSGPQDRR